ncbi:double zinc ribbon domain-containing protein [Acidithiobacillus sp. IBUN Pt1247-S3]|uniref:double zinc ribbon domain-containing protein n=1 Tax=Acidithiobacillus sp. IBUN Pt1247-S3 TaxID=3166642 RepID=UPI0034E3B1E8
MLLTRIIGSQGREFWGNGSRRLASWLLPENCRFCSAPGAAICADCLRELPRLPADRCSWCALPVNDDGDCPVCSVEAPSYDYTFCPFVYTTPLAEAISAWKFHAGLDWTRPLANAWIEAWADAAPAKPDALLPVPAHPARLRERGYNQAMLLAQHWGRHYGIARRDVLRRVRNTPHQVGGSRDQRRANLRSAFAVRAQLPAHVALVDDVLTTGSTAEALARLLKAHGVERVDLWILARAL